MSLQPVAVGRKMCGGAHTILMELFLFFFLYIFLFLVTLRERFSVLLTTSPSERTTGNAFSWFFGGETLRH